MVTHIARKEVYEDDDGDRIEQLVPSGELTQPPKIVKIRPVGRHRMVVIGRGRHGRHIEVTFSKPKRPDKLGAIDDNTGEKVFAPARKVEQSSSMHLHAHDFPEESASKIAAELDPALLQGSHPSHLKRTIRAHWPRVEAKMRPPRPKRTKVDESDVPWSDPTKPQPDDLHFVRYTKR